jgi:hypothetical protein
MMVEGTEEEKSDKKSEEKEQRVEQEKQDLLAKVAASETSTMRQRVAWLLNHFPRTRNSDIALQISTGKYSSPTLLRETMYVLRISIGCRT